MNIVVNIILLKSTMEIPSPQTFRVSGDPKFLKIPH